MGQNYVLAYDLGTSGVKSILITTDGTVVAASTAAYPLYTPQPGWAEQVPEDYWRGVCEATRAVLVRANVSPDEILGLAFGTMWKGIIPIDKNGAVLHNSIIWLDARAGEAAERLNNKMGTPGRLFSASDYWSKLAWLQENHPEIVENAVMILETNSYLKWRATGAVVVDISNSFTRSFDPKLDEYYEKLLLAIGIPREKFPPIIEATALAGYVTEKAAEELGLVPGIPVFGGNNDIQAVTVGAGCSQIGSVHMYFGSSGWTGYTIPHTPQHGLSPFDAERDIHLKGMQAIGLSFNWVVKKLYSAEYGQCGDAVFAEIDREVADIPAGSNGVFATPWFYGEWPPLFGPDARGNFLNLGPAHDRRHMARAMMEGVCYHLKMQVQNMGRSRPEGVTVIGGGSRSDVWMQILADVMDMPVRVPKDTCHAGAIGTAYSALIGLGICSDYGEADNRVQIECTYLPNPEAVAVYRENYEVFEQLYTMLKPMFSRMNG